MTLADCDLASCTLNTGASGSAGGAAIFVDNGCDVVCTRCNFVECELNAKHAYGGAVHCAIWSSASLADCSFLRCAATSFGDLGVAFGGAVFGNVSSTMLISSSTFDSCIADSSGDTVQAGGGALGLANSCTAALTACAVTFCAATASGTGLSYGGALWLSEGSNASLLNSTILGCSARTEQSWRNRGGPASAGGGVYLQAVVTGCVLTVEGSSVINCTAGSANTWASGGALALFHESSATLTSCVVLGCRAESLREEQQPAGQWSHTRASGGAVHVDSRCVMSMISSSVESCTAESVTGNASGGALYGRLSAEVSIFASTITRCSARSERALALGGGIALLDSCVAHLSACRVESCTTLSLHWAASGGGVYARSATLRLDAATLLRSNTASAPSRANLQTAAESSSTMALEGGSFADYVLPAPSGRWLAASECRVFRQPCPAEPVSVRLQCLATADECTTIASANASVGGVPCQPAAIVQPCRWDVYPEQIDKYVFVLPLQSVSFEFPFSCAPGLLGGSVTGEQLSPFCAGRCPAGRLCDQPASVDPALCPRGHACVRPGAGIESAWSNEASV